MSNRQSIFAFGSKFLISESNKSQYQFCKYIDLNLTSKKVI